MYEDKFRKGLQMIIITDCLKQSAIAAKAGIRSDVLSKILNGRRRIFAEDVGGICRAIDKTFEDVISRADQEPA